MFKTVGRTEKGGQGSVLLLPEEALWALETARLDVRWGEEEEEQEDRRKVEDDSQDDTQQADEVDGLEQDDEEGQDDDAELDLMPMSLQGAYAAYLGGESERNGFLTLERYLVYAGLKRSGFTVLRAEGWDGRPVTEKPPPEEKYATIEQPNQPSIFSWFYNIITTTNQDGSSAPSREGPLVKPSVYRTYNDIFRLLHIIPSWQPHLQSSTPTLTSTPIAMASAPSDSTSDSPSTDMQNPNTPFTTHFNVYRPGPHFRKTRPGPPDLRISVIDARTTALPSLSELNQLIAAQPTPTPGPASTTKPQKPANSSSKPQPHTKQTKAGEPQTQTTYYEPSPSSTPLSYFSRLFPSLPNYPSTSKPTAIHYAHDSIPAFYRRLKTGQNTPARNIVLAIVDEGVISYVRFTEGVFGSERVWERVVAAAERGSGGAKGGGGGGRGGRGGRGRGRGGRGGGR